MKGVIYMLGRKSRLAVLSGLLIFILLIMCSCSGSVKIFVQIINEHTDTINFTIYNSSGSPLKQYTGVTLQPEVPKKVTLDFAEGYYMNFFTNIGGDNYIWNEEIGSVETHDIPWVNGKTYLIGDPDIGEWQLMTL